MIKPEEVDDTSSEFVTYLHKNIVEKTDENDNVYYEYKEYKNDTCYAYVGGYCSYGANAGAFYCNLNNLFPYYYSSLGASISCKPLATV